MPQICIIIIEHTVGNRIAQKELNLNFVDVDDDDNSNNETNNEEYLNLKQAIWWDVESLEYSKSFSKFVENKSFYK